MILQTLQQQCIKNVVRFFDEYRVAGVLLDGDRCGGVVEPAPGEVHQFRSEATLFATGGFGRMFRIAPNAYANTGVGSAALARRGVPLEDMEFFPFYPTGIRGMGILVSDEERGEGGRLFQKEDERFMERCAPALLDLAPRDMVFRAIKSELQKGRGMRGDRKIDDRVHLDATHVDRETIMAKLPDITDFRKTYLGADPAEEPIPVHPCGPLPGHDRGHEEISLRRQGGGSPGQGRRSLRLLHSLGGRRQAGPRNHAVCLPDGYGRHGGSFNAKQRNLGRFGTGNGPGSISSRPAKKTIDIPAGLFYKTVRFRRQGSAGGNMQDPDPQ